MIHDLSHAIVWWMGQKSKYIPEILPIWQSHIQLTQLTLQWKLSVYYDKRWNLLMGVWILINVVSFQTNFEYENKSFLWELITQQIPFCSDSTLA